MNKIKLVWLVVALSIIPNIAFTQNNTNSPYTRYGYGSLADKAFTSQRAMGGIGYGVRSSYMINPMNPASYSGIDSLTFMFDLGATAQFAWFNDGIHKERKLNGNLEYIGLQFPLIKKMGFGVGLEPFSYVGYHYGTTEKLEVEDGYAQMEYSGTGGLSKVYGSLSYDLFNRLSLGVKVAYLYGDILHNKAQYILDAGSYNVSWTDTLRTTGLTYDFGLQYHQSAGKNKTLVVGLVYSPKIRIHEGVKKGTLRLSSGGAIINSENYSATDSVFELPESYGLGFTYNKLYHYTFGADVLLQRWADAKFYDQTNALNNRLKINLGGEYIPNLMTNKYYNRIRYRAGLSYTNSYLKIKDSGYKEYGASIGFGLPMVDRRSFVNLAFEYSLIQPEVKTYIKEQYFKFTLSYTFNELWFFKQKLQ
ncbi:membrane protein [Bacteroidia bacterium]|nr:membrane protein [Bacteroidia bacterium]